MSTYVESAHGAHDDHAHHDSGAQTVLGFWLYLMTDCILFATAFAGYAVLYRNIASGPMGKEIFDLPYVIVETAALLLSSITYGFAMIAGYKGNKKATLAWLALTFAFGATFIGIVSLTLALVGRRSPANPGKAMARLTLSYGAAQIIARPLASKSIQRLPSGFGCIA